MSFLGWMFGYEPVKKKEADDASKALRKEVGTHKERAAIAVKVAEEALRITRINGGKEGHDE